MSQYRPYLTARAYLFRIYKGDELLAAVQDFCHENQIKCGTISAIGAIKDLTVGFYDQKKKKYIKQTYQGHFEILNLTGNISIMDSHPMAHIHITVADEKNRAFGGHLMAGTKVFACEVFVQELVGTAKTRKTDKKTGLPLWS
jgi:predicted DNA-binding protein with PD1-like motif